MQTDVNTQMDIEIICAVLSGGMHNWFVMMTRYHMSSDQLTERVKEIREDADYYKAIKELANERLQQLKLDG